jgi:Flp pilus assembly pilin Flp
VPQVSTLLRRLLGDQRGVAAIEMALIAPVLLAMTLGMSEVAMKMLAQYKAAQTATTVADMVARYQTLSKSDVSGLLDASSKVIGTADFSTSGRIILSSVTKSVTATSPTIVWQCTGGGGLSQTSRLGIIGSAASLPGNLALDNGDNIIVAEVFYSYVPVISFLDSQSTTLYNVATFRPRLGALTTAPGC